MPTVVVPDASGAACAGVFPKHFAHYKDKRLAYINAKLSYEVDISFEPKLVFDLTSKLVTTPFNQIKRNVNPREKAGELVQRYARRWLAHRTAAKRRKELQEMDSELMGGKKRYGEGGPTSRQMRARFSELSRLHAELLEGVVRPRSARAPRCRLPPSPPRRAGAHYRPSLRAAPLCSGRRVGAECGRQGGGGGDGAVVLHPRRIVLPSRRGPAEAPVLRPLSRQSGDKRLRLPPPKSWGKRPQLRRGVQAAYLFVQSPCMPALTLSLAVPLRCAPSCRTEDATEDPSTV